jgi:hypothetical protein
MPTLFHVTIDDSRRMFWLDGAGSTNAMRLHYEIVRHARDTGAKLREHDVFAASQDEALAQIAQSLPGYEFAGAWAGNLPA